MQKFIRENGLAEMAIGASGPKGTVSSEDVHAALAIKSKLDEEALSPVTIDFKPMVGHLFETPSLPTSAVTNKKELLEYYRKVAVRSLSYA